LNSLTLSVRSSPTFSLFFNLESGLDSDLFIRMISSNKAVRYLTAV
jgi:hypothetical protein